jgi:hypothetical protein
MHAVVLYPLLLRKLTLSKNVSPGVVIFVISHDILVLSVIKNTIRPASSSFFSLAKLVTSGILQ